MKNVIISDLDRFSKIKKNILKDRFENLHFISDFDRTLTHAFINNGEHVSSLISILRDENYLVDGYADKAKALFEYYHPIEVSSSVGIEDKKKFMEEWWTKHSDLLIESGFNKKDLVEAAKSKRIKFRDKVFETIILLDNVRVPFLILSGNGLGEDSIIETMKFHKLYLDNICVISNKYIWDENGNAIDYHKPHIHTFNKNETSVIDSQFYPRIKNRRNVILLGDSLGDVNMAEGFDYDNLLKIGFLNFNVEKDLEEYKKNYDVIVTNDSSMEFVYELLREFRL
ncbi:MAG: hypothetical protein KC550_00985 [Nanoarchaeota archaeon]|nr:hypothetical protein [Nanoarchaeota archaeon]